MDAKTILNPKWWLIAFGALFLLAGAGNYFTAESSADTAYPGDFTERDVFYEQTFGLFTMVAATLALVTGLTVTGRPLSVLAMTSSGVMLAFLLLHYMAGENVNYGYNDPVMLGAVMSLVALLGVSGFLHLDGGTETPEDSSGG